MITAAITLGVIVVLAVMFAGTVKVHQAGYSARTEHVIDGFVRAVKNKPSIERTEQLLRAYLKNGDEREAVIQKCSELLGEITHDAETSKKTVATWVADYDAATLIDRA